MVTLIHVALLFTSLRLGACAAAPSLSLPLPAGRGACRVRFRHLPHSGCKPQAQRPGAGLGAQLPAQACLVSTRSKGLACEWRRRLAWAARLLAAAVATACPVIAAAVLPEIVAVKCACALAGTLLCVEQSRDILFSAAASAAVAAALRSVA